ncbi:MAG: hypothetical protein FWC71_11675 [Defluviitaleaceae bacterium]|nr:hypothetical protein [Defluviitaleaceae bacterium]
MDCLKAETAMMHYVEQTLKPKDIQPLATHILQCEPCRALYLLLDEQAEILAAPQPAETSEMPTNFTQVVMAQVRMQPAYVPTPAASIGQRILWVVAGILIGTAALLALNPQWAISFAIHEGLVMLGAHIGNLLSWLTQADTINALINSGLGIAALIFSVLIGGALYGLYRGEHATNHQLQA